MNNIDSLKRLMFLISNLPDGLRADWDGTNHYELTVFDPEGGYWWLNLSDVIHEDFDSDSEEGKRLGLLFDLAEAAKAAEGQLREIADGRGGE